MADQDCPKPPDKERRAVILATVGVVVILGVVVFCIAVGGRRSAPPQPRDAAKLDESRHRSSEEDTHDENASKLPVTEPVSDARSDPSRQTPPNISWGQMKGGLRLGLAPRQGWLGPTDTRIEVRVWYENMGTKPIQVPVHQARGVNAYRLMFAGRKHDEPFYACWKMEREELVGPGTRILKPGEVYSEVCWLRVPVKGSPAAPGLEPVLPALDRPGGDVLELRAGLCPSVDPSGPGDWNNAQTLQSGLVYVNRMPLPLARIGDWLIPYSTVSIEDDGALRWESAPRLPDGSWAEFWIFSKALEVRADQAPKEMHLKGIGRVKVIVWVRIFTGHRRGGISGIRSRLINVTLVFHHDRGGQRYYLRRPLLWEDLEALKHYRKKPYRELEKALLALGRKERESLAEAVRKEVMAKVADDPLTGLLRTALSREIPLGRLSLTDGYPTVEASIGGRRFAQLERVGESKKDRTGTWKLPAKPGQEVTFRIHVPVRSFTITSTRGIQEDEARGKLLRNYVTLEGKEVPIPDDGFSVIHYGKLKNRLPLHFSYWHWRHKDFPFRGTIEP